MISLLSLTLQCKNSLKILEKGGVTFANWKFCLALTVRLNRAATNAFQEINIQVACSSEKTFRYTLLTLFTSDGAAVLAFETPTVDDQKTQF